VEGREIEGRTKEMLIEVYRGALLDLPLGTKGFMMEMVLGDRQALELSLSNSNYWTSSLPTAANFHTLSHTSSSLSLSFFLSSYPRVSCCEADYQSQHRRRRALSRYTQRSWSVAIKIARRTLDANNTIYFTDNLRRHRCVL